MTNTPSEQPAIPEGMVRWAGGDRAPSDWDGGPVLFRDGKLFGAPVGHIWKLGWDHSYGTGDIIAYTPKPAIPASAGEAWLDSYSARNPDLEDSFTRDDMLLAFEAGARAIEQPAQASEVERLREALKLFVSPTMFETRPSRGETFIGWQRGDGPTAKERLEIARAALNPSQERAEAGK